MSLARWTVLIALSACSPHSNREPPSNALPLVPLPWLDLAADAALAGTIKTTTGEPVRGAHVCAWHDFPEQLPADARAPVCTTSGDDGSFEINGLVPAAWHVHASAPTFQPAALDSPVPLLPAQQHRNLNLVLTPGGAELRGQIVDLHGAPIRDALVTNFLVTHLVPERGAAAATRSDVDGRFSLWLKSGHHHVVADAPGFTRTVVFHDTATPPLPIHLAPEATLSGAVLDATTRLPVAGARVRVTANDPTWPEATASAYTDAAGRYRVSGLAPGKFTVRAEIGNRRGEADRYVLLDLTESATLQPIAITSLPSVRARVLDCSGGHVFLRDGAREAIGPDGEVFIPALERHQHELELHCHDHTYGHALVEPADALTGLFWRPGERVEPVRHAIASPNAGTVHGLVVDRSGEPVRHATISLRTPGDDTLHVPFEDSTTAAGAFAIHDIIPGEYTVIVSGPGVEPTRTADSEIDVEPGSLRELRLTLPVTTAPIRGRVVESGAPIVGALVTAMQDIPADFATPPPTWNFADPFTLTDADGRFTLDAGHPQGDRVVWAFTPIGKGLVRTTSREVTVEIPHLTTLAGTVTGPAPSRFAVAVAGPTGEFDDHRAFQRTDGRWGFEGLPPGTHDILLLSRVGCAEVRIDVVPGERREDLVLSPGSPGGLRGRVIDGVTREPAAFAEIHLSHHDARLAPLESDLGWYTATTDADGRFEFLGLCFGEIEISASLGSYAASHRVLVAPGEIAGVSLALQPTGVSDFD